MDPGHPDHFHQTDDLHSMEQEIQAQSGFVKS
jgi:hypothetical protein